jgi:hypothetical protein
MMMTVIQAVCLNFVIADKELRSLFFVNATRGARLQIRTQIPYAGLTQVSCWERSGILRARPITRQCETVAHPASTFSAPI